MGDHVLTIRVSDAVGNTTYKTFEVRDEYWEPTPAFGADGLWNHND